MNLSNMATGASELSFFRSLYRASALNSSDMSRHLALRPRSPFSCHSCSNASYARRAAARAFLVNASMKRSKLASSSAGGMATKRVSATIASFARTCESSADMSTPCSLRRALKAAKASRSISSRASRRRFSARLISSVADSKTICRSPSSRASQRGSSESRRSALRSVGRSPNSSHSQTISTNASRAARLACFRPCFSTSARVVCHSTNKSLRWDSVFTAA
mmetsp:Transcript_55063/g.123113  ORF Transcript_55063/g.123113 Transcript_55063/m.123113 type:complete len:222 (+) Transcript_55063:904-1569(+)